VSSNPLANLKIDYWYKALLVIGACVLIVSLSVEMKGVDNSVVQLVSLGAILIGIGEWINHPLRTTVVPGWIGTSYPRINTWSGNLFDLTGVICVSVGIVKTLL